MEKRSRGLARALYETVCDLPILSPHGHTNPAWFAQNHCFENPAALFVTADHYVFRMLYSKGMSLNDLGVPRRDWSIADVGPRTVWRSVAGQYHLFRGTPSEMWINYSLSDVFGIEAT